MFSLADGREEDGVWPQSAAVSFIAVCLFYSTYILRWIFQVETTWIQGCLDGLEILQQIYPEDAWAPINWTQGLTNDLEFLNWQGCPINLEAGFHFMGKGQLMRL